MTEKKQYSFFEQQPTPQFGTEPKKLVRRHDPGTSVKAACAVDAQYWERKVYEVILSFGKVGCISDQILDQFPHVPYSTITARYRGLQDKGLIYYDGDKEKGKSGRNQRVIRAKK